MKIRSNLNRLRWLPASALLLLAAACADNASLDVASVDKLTSVVNFTIEPQLQVSSTRADGETLSHISDGTKADVLVYAVYEVTGEGDNEKLELQEIFGKAGTTIGAVTTGEGQKIVSANKFPLKISLAIDPEKKYKVAFWLQNKDTKAYDATDLEHVKVNYKDGDKNFANNDESRDAFCALSGVINALSLENYVTLRRPLAQINVGTTGWDYEGAAILKPSKVSYTKSQITLNDVAQYYNVVAGKTLTKSELESKNISDTETTSVTFDYATLPAFINATEDEWKNLSYKPVKNEEYLRVDVNGDHEFAPYVGWYEHRGEVEPSQTRASDGDASEKPETEMFKYLSMSYVLVPEAHALAEDEAPKATNGAVLSSVSFKAIGVDEDGNETGIAKGFEIKNVPVQKNWRTNILGDSFFTYNQKFNIHIVTDYCGNYNDTDTPIGNWPEYRRQELDTYVVSFKEGTADTPATYTAENTDDFFTIEGDETTTSYGKGAYEGKDYEYGLKMNGNGHIKFATSDSAYVYIVQSTKINGGDNNVSLKINSEELNSTESPEGSSNVRVFVLEKPAGSYDIQYGGSESGIFCVKVVTYEYVEAKSPNEDFNGEYGEDYNGTESGSDPDGDPDTDNDQ